MIGNNNNSALQVDAGRAIDTELSWFAQWKKSAATKLVRNCINTNALALVSTTHQSWVAEDTEICA